MTIENLSIDSFGGLENRTFAFGPGLNLVQGPNESGKSTLFAFIKFVLYGASRRSSEAEMSDRARYMNWNAASMGGSMTVNCDGKRYRIERRLTVSSTGERETARDVCRVFDAESGEVCFRGEVPGEHFFGVPENVFSQTALMGQMSDGSIDGRDIGEAIENILFSGDEAVNTGKALKKLDQARIALLHKSGNGGQLSDLNREISQLQEHLTRATQVNSQIIALEGAVKAAEASREASRQKLALCSRKCDLYEAMVRMRRFQLLHAHEEKAAALEQEKAQMVAARGNGGSLPTVSWLAGIDVQRQQIQEVGDETENLRQETEMLRTAAENNAAALSAARKLEASGGRDAVLRQNDALERKCRKGKTIAVISLIGSAVFLGAGIFARLTNFLPSAWGKLPSLFSLLLGGIFAAVAAVAGIISTRRKKKMQMLLSEFGVKDAAELERMTALWLQGQEEAKRQEEELHRTETRLSLQEEQLLSLRSRLHLSLSAWAEVSGKQEEEDIFAFCRETVSLAERLDKEIEQQKNAVQNARNELKGISEEETASELEGIDLENLSEENITNLRRERDFTSQAISQLDAKIAEKSNALAGLRATWNNPAWIAAQLEERREMHRQLSDRLQALQLAHAALDRAASGLRGSISPRLGKRTAELVGLLTDGKYDRVGVDPAWKVNYETASQTHSTEYMSAGTKTVTYMALRIALIQLLYTRTRPPLVLDESLAHLDDDRAARFLQLLRELENEGIQTILFSCHGREASLASRDGTLHLLRLEEKPKSGDGIHSGETKEPEKVSASDETVSDK